MPFPFAGKILAAAGLAVLNHLFRSRSDSPEVAAYEARGEVRSEVTPRRWVVGSARVAGVLARHADMIYAPVAQDYWDTHADEDDNDRLRGATERMRLYGYFAYALAEGEDRRREGRVGKRRADARGLNRRAPDLPRPPLQR